MMNKINKSGELSIAKNELAFGNEEKEKWASELSIANIELLFKHEEQERRAAKNLLS